MEGEYEHQLSLDGYPGEEQAELEQGYLRWQATDALSLRAGRFNTPFGWWVPIHWSVLMDSATPPMYVGNELIPEQQLGLELAGRHFPGNVAGLDSEVGWSLFGGYGSQILGHDHSDGLSIGGDLRLRLAERFLLGASAYRQKNSQLDDHSELNSVLYGEARLPWALTLRSEYVFTHRDPVGQLARNAESLYASLRWDAHRLLYLAYRFGYGDQDDTQTLRTGERAIHTITLGILPLPDVKVKLEYNHNELWNGAGSDFDHWVVSLGYSF